MKIPSAPSASLGCLATTSVSPSSILLALAVSYLVYNRLGSFLYLLLTMPAPENGRKDEASNDSSRDVGDKEKDRDRPAKSKGAPAKCA